MTLPESPRNVIHVSYDRMTFFFPVPNASLHRFHCRVLAELGSMYNALHAASQKLTASYFVLPSTVAAEQPVHCSSSVEMVSIKFSTSVQATSL